MNESELSGRLGLAGWPAVAEEAIIARDCLLTAHVGSRLHVCHVSTAGSVEIVRDAKRKGWNVTAEACPHHLLLTDELAATYDPIYKVNPPLRSTVRRRGAARRPGRRHDRHRRHRPRAAPARGQGLRVGGRRVRHARPRDRAVDRAAHDGRHRPARLGRRRRADVLRPARIGRVADHGRPIEVGAPANIVLYDPAATRTIDAAESASLSRNTPYAGMELPGRIEATFLRGTAHGSRREAGRDGDLGARGRAHLPRRHLRRRGRDVRRSGLQHRHDRLPGDADRPVLPPPGRRDDGSAHRQHRHQRRGPGVPPDLGRRVRRPRPRARASATGARAAPSTTSCAPRAWSGSAASTPGR